MISSSPTTITCPACGNANAPDSRFCRHCGAALEAKPGENGARENSAHEPHEHSAAELKAESKVEAHAPILSPLPVAPIPQADTSKGDGEEERSSPAEIDARRARQLLDRSLYLSERGDAAGAILACRQAIALAPTVASGYSMLGLLLERTGDLAHSVTAYEKAVQLAPNHALERESLERLREKMQGQKGAEIFHFDDAELFDDQKPDVSSPKTAAATSILSDEPVEAPLPNISAAAPGLPAGFTGASSAPSASSKASAAAETPIAKADTKADAKSAAPSLAATIAAQLPAITPPVVAVSPPVERRAQERRRNAVPVMAERRLSAERRVPVTNPARAGSAPKVAPIFIPGVSDAPPPGTTWDKMWKRPSYYGRSLPLVGATVLCLGFLLWARSWAVARTVANTQVAATTADTVADPAPAPNFVPVTDPNRVGAPPPLAPVGSNPASNGGFPISNGAINPALPSVAPVQGGGSSNSRVAASSNNGGGGTRVASATTRRSPSFPRMIPPAAIPNQSTTGSGSNGNGSNSRSGGNGNSNTLVLPSPNLGAPASPASQPVTVLPQGGGAPALNPAGDSNRGYVRITQGRIGTSALPQRAASQAGDDERNAANSSRAGQSDRAIQQLSSAINSDASDAGYRFQQRASLFLARGDYSRAADDFQSAISAYNDQIGRGEQVNAARAGLRAARSGLNVALAGGNR